MGAFFTNYQVRSESQSAVVEAMKNVASARAYVSPPIQGWVTVYDEKSDEQDDAVLNAVAKSLSQALATHVISFLVHDSDVFMYLLYAKGKLEDEYNSAPDYFDDADAATRRRFKGKPDVLRACASVDCSQDDLREAIDSEEQGIDAEGTLARVAELLGIDESRASLGFRYFEEEPDAVGDADEFVAVGSGATKKPRSRKAGRKQPEAPAPDAMARFASDAYAMAVTMLFHSMTMRERFGKMSAESSGVARLLFPGKSQPSFDQAFASVEKKTRNEIKNLLRSAKASGGPAPDEIFAAADKGHDALAAFVAERMPTHLSMVLWHMASSGDSPQAVKSLLDKGASPNADHAGYTALMHAAAGGHTEVAELLLARGADVNVRAPDGSTALSRAIAAGKGRRETAAVIMLLRRAGAKE